MEPKIRRTERCTPARWCTRLSLEREAVRSPCGGRRRIAKLALDFLILQMLVRGPPPPHRPPQWKCAVDRGAVSMPSTGISSSVLFSVLAGWRGSEKLQQRGLLSPPKRCLPASNGGSSVVTADTRRRHQSSRSGLGSTGYSWTRSEHARSAPLRWHWTDLGRCAAIGRSRRIPSQAQLSPAGSHQVQSRAQRRCAADCSTQPENTAT